MSFARVLYVCYLLCCILLYFSCLYAKALCLSRMQHGFDSRRRYKLKIKRLSIRIVAFLFVYSVQIRIRVRIVRFIKTKTSPYTHVRGLAKYLSNTFKLKFYN